MTRLATLQRLARRLSRRRRRLRRHYRRRRDRLALTRTLQQIRAVKTVEPRRQLRP